MLDLDHFKRINDSLGHQVGDKLLLQISQRLQDRVREVDTVARLGGDEFVIVLTGTNSTVKIQALIDELMQTISAPMTIEGHELLITTSIGGCVFPADGNDPGTLLKNADTAMYHAKTTGRSNFQWFTSALMQDRKSVVEGKRVSVRVDLGGG